MIAGMSTELSSLRATNLCRYFKRGQTEIKALDDITLDIHKGEFVAIVGSSGSGKSTLLAIMAGLDTPSSGSIEIEGRGLHGMTRRELSSHRAHRVGMIFQSFNLISHYTALQNVEAALLFNQTPHKERRRLASETLERLGLSDRLTHRPAYLSGGEQQRVAIARAIVKHPDVLFADEPTGNLDHENADQTAQIIANLNRDGQTIVMVTHNLDLARQYAHRIIRLHYGKIVEDVAIDRSGSISQ
jgi:putative ABC transport system ATP-binding protein